MWRSICPLAGWVSWKAGVTLRRWAKKQKLRHDSSIPISAPIWLQSSSLHLKGKMKIIANRCRNWYRDGECVVVSLHCSADCGLLVHLEWLGERWMSNSSLAKPLHDGSTAHKKLSINETQQQAELIWQGESKMLGVCGVTGPALLIWMKMALSEPGRHVSYVALSCGWVSALVIRIKRSYFLACAEEMPAWLPANCLQVSGGN